jgi:predicted metal-dependent phosphoesterase TrpH
MTVSDHRETETTVTPSGRFACDLHLHSTNSDGLIPPEEVIALAARAGLSMACLSDHSRPTYSPALRDFAARQQITLLPGLEISTMHGRRKYHVLAYGNGVLDDDFLDFAFRPTAVKNSTYRQVLGGLRAQGVRLPDDADILAGRDGSDTQPRHAGKWMFSSTLIGRYLGDALGVDPSVAAARVKARYNALKGDEPGRYVPTEETIARVRRAGAIPVLAHPFWECHRPGNTWADVLDDLRRFAGLGLVGMEVSSRHEAPVDEQGRTSAARRLGLVPFRSSDFHGNGKTEVGQFPMNVDELAEAGDRCGADIPLPAGARTESAKGGHG